MRSSSDCAQSRLSVEELEVGELWGFVVAMDATTKLVASFVVGEHPPENALALMPDLQWRINHRFQLTPDGFSTYVSAVETFDAGTDCAQLVKIYSGEEAKRGRYSPSEFVKAIPAEEYPVGRSAKPYPPPMEQSEHEDADASLHEINQRVL